MPGFKRDVKLPYYSFAFILSHNAVINMVVGARGVGKTFGAKKKAVKDAIATGEQFIYLRRYSDELKVARETFFADIQGEFKSHDFRVNGFKAEMSVASSRNDKKRKWQVIGYFLPLSTAQFNKGSSFHLVTKIIFDEFIIEKGLIRYIENEWNVFLNFFNTVDRSKDKTTVYMLANSASVNNPYFLELGIMPDPNTDLLILGDGFVAVHFPDSKEFANAVNQTRFGKFIAGTEYADYSVGNAFGDNNEFMIGNKDSKALYMLSLETKVGKFSIWKDLLRGNYFATQKAPRQEMIYTMVPELMMEGKFYVTSSSKVIKALKGSFTAGRMYFDEPQTRNSLIEIFK